MPASTRSAYAESLMVEASRASVLDSGRRSPAGGAERREGLPSGYRSDIDGLRAVAILLVLAYHVAPVTFSGGFVGVDVFFVISGFLITRILLADTAPGRYRRFYGRRVRRLAPALLIVLVATLVLGGMTLLAEPLRALARHTVAAVLFVANIVFWRESGYFDAAAIDKPLLHLWSLGVEEQFYLAWPLTLWWLARRPGRVLPVTVALAAASFLACIVTVGRAPDAAFYLPWYRIWEPLVGAVLAVATLSADRLSRPASEVLSWTGLALVAASALVLGGGAPFPSWTALAPVLGTAMLVRGGERSWLGRRVLSWRPAVVLGLISYPLYLWHWSLISLLSDPGPSESVASRLRLCLLAVVLALLTYGYVERPVQRLYRRRPRITVTGLVGAAAAVVALSISLIALRIPLPVQSNPAMARIEEAHVLDAALRSQFDVRRCPATSTLATRIEPYCTASGPTRERGPILIWGDSTADSWAPLVRSLARERGQAAVVLSVSGCPPLLGVRGPLHPGCDLDDSAWKAELIEELEPSHIVISARWGAYVNATPGASPHENHLVTLSADGPATEESSRAAIRAALPVTLEWLTELAPVVVIASPPDLLFGVARGLFLDLEYRPTRAQHRKAQEIVAGILEESASRIPGFAVLDPADRLCGEERCTGILDDTIVYLDTNHVTAQGALLFRDGLIEGLARAERSAMAAADEARPGGAVEPE